MVQVLRGHFGPHYDVRSPDAVSEAALNLSSKPRDVENNLRLAEKVITPAKQAHPGLRRVVLPELFISGYTSLHTTHLHAEDAGEGPSVQRFLTLARSLGLYIAYGFAERLPGTSGPVGIADSANIVGPEGVLLTYRKRYLVRETGEDRVFVPGVDVPTVEAGGLRVSLVICWDLGFPEVVREAALEGTELILAPTGWRELYARQYELSCAARALDNGIHLASANQVGDYPEARFGTPGGVYGPDGLPVSESFGEWSVGQIDAGASALWRSSYGNTLRKQEAQAGSLEACS